MLFLHVKTVFPFPFLPFRNCLDSWHAAVDGKGHSSSASEIQGKVYHHWWFCGTSCRLSWGWMPVSEIQVACVRGPQRRMAELQRSPEVSKYCCDSSTAITEVQRGGLFWARGVGTHQYRTAQGKNMSVHDSFDCCSSGKYFQICLSRTFKSLCLF